MEDQEQPKTVRHGISDFAGKKIAWKAIITIAERVFLIHNELERADDNWPKGKQSRQEYQFCSQESVPSTKHIINVILARYQKPNHIELIVINIDTRRLEGIRKQAGAASCEDHSEETQLLDPRSSRKASDWTSTESLNSATRVL